VREKFALFSNELWKQVSYTFIQIPKRDKPKKRFAKINLGTVPDNRFGILFEEECKDTGVPEAFDPKAVTSGNGTLRRYRLGWPNV
jgi:hypothetical protein